MPDLPTRYGTLAIPDVADDLIVGFLRRYGEWAWDETCFIADNLRDGARIADIGAFLGTFALGVTQRRRLDYICSVEPNPEIVPLLRENIERNCDAQSTVMAAAVAPVGSGLKEGVYDQGNLGSFGYTDRSRAGEKRSWNGQVETIDLGSLRRQFGEFDLIKIDAEGLEADILESELFSLVRAKTDLWIEANESPETIRLGTMLLEAEMRVHYFAWSSFNPDNLRGDSTPIYPFAYEAGLYATVSDPPVLTPSLQAHHPILKRIKTRADLLEALWITPRWGMAEWFGRTLPEVVALAGRELRGETRPNFPTSSRRLFPAESPIVALRDRLRDTEQALTHAASLAFERLSHLQSLGAELDAATKLLHDRDRHIAVLEEQLRALSSTLRLMESSAMWRATELVRQFLLRHPGLGGCMRSLARTARSIAGHKRRDRGEP